MRIVQRCLFLIALAIIPAVVDAQQITAAGQPAQLDIRVAGEASIRVTLKPLSFKNQFPDNPSIAERTYPAPALRLRAITTPVKKRVGSLTVDVRHNPLTISVRNAAGQPVQEVVFEDDGTLSFALDEHPVLGMGEGGPRPVKGTPWREQPVQFDRRGQLDTMQPRWQADMYGSRNPVAMLLGTAGWGMFVAAPWGQVDLRQTDRGLFLPWEPTEADRAPQTTGNQQQSLAKGLPPAESVVAGLYDIFIFDAHDPAKAMKDFSVITGPAAMPPLWALGYMQSHRTLEDDSQMLGIVETFRKKQIPLDAVIYLGTGFIPRGWNTRQPSFDFNPEVFTRDPKAVIADIHAQNVKVVVHMVPWDRDKLPTLHGTIPQRPGEEVDGSHIQSYWQQHVPLIKSGIDAFWPDEGDWFNLFERIKRHQLYYQGHLSTEPNERPWHLQRNGYPGIAQWGGWVWSGDTDSSWKTLEAQMAVGLNYSLSIGPYWGSDIGGFYPNNELTGELYARWFQFAAFSGSFRSHGRVWWTRLPWGWGLSDRGPQEYGNTNAPIPPDDRRNILLSEMNNQAIEPIAKKYAELRYQLLPYTYTLAWEARDTGMPLMRAMWLHYPDDVRARGLGSQFMWGRDLLIAPVFTKGARSREVYLPKGEWYDWWTNERSTGGRSVTRAVDLATMPIYVRAGAIIPFDPVRQYTGEPVSEPTTLRVYRGADGEYTLYQDDGISQDYLKARGTWTRMTWNDDTRQLTIEPGAPKGATNVSTKRSFRVQVLPEGTTKEVNYTGERIRVGFAQEKPPSTPAARPMRTEADARARGEANRREREAMRVTSGAPVELISDYVDANIGPVPESLGVSPFYKKYADAQGIPVIASDKVPDAALLVARDIVNSMLAARPDIRKALTARGWRTGVIAEVEMTMDIPEYSKMKRPGAPRDEPVTQADRDYHANRSRGLGGNPTTGAEENLLGYPGTRYWGEHIFVHEFAHAIMGGGIRTVDVAMHAEIRAAYDTAMAAGKYVHADGRKHYATTNANEYWAEGVQWWFFSNYGECFAGNVKVETPEEFAVYDPALNELISRVFTTHRIPMDVFHGKRIRPVECGAGK